MTPELERILIQRYPQLRLWTNRSCMVGDGRWPVLDALFSTVVLHVSVTGGPSPRATNVGDEDGLLWVTWDQADEHVEAATAMAGVVSGLFAPKQACRAN